MSNDIYVKILLGDGCNGKSATWNLRGNPENTPSAMRGSPDLIREDGGTVETENHLNHILTPIVKMWLKYT